MNGTHKYGSQTASPEYHQVGFGYCNPHPDHAGLGTSSSNPADCYAACLAHANMYSKICTGFDTRNGCLCYWGIQVESASGYSGIEDKYCHAVNACPWMVGGVCHYGTGVDPRYTWVAGPSGTGCSAVCTAAGLRLGRTMTSEGFTVQSLAWLGERFTAAGVYDATGTDGRTGPGCQFMNDGDSDLFCKTYTRGRSGRDKGITETDEAWGDCYGAAGITLGADYSYSNNGDGSL